MEIDETKFYQAIYSYNIWLAGLARSVEAQRKRVPPGGGETYLDLLRLGRVVTLWRSLDGKKAGWVDPKTGARREFPPDRAAFFSREISRALEILRRKATPGISLLPFPQLPQAGKEEKR